MRGRLARIFPFRAFDPTVLYVGSIWSEVGCRPLQRRRVGVELAAVSV